MHHIELRIALKLRKLLLKIKVVRLQKIQNSQIILFLFLDQKLYLKNFQEAICKFQLDFQNTGKIGSNFQNLKSDAQIIHIRNFCKKNSTMLCSWEL